MIDKLRQLKHDDNAVSPVIAVILMIAVTVVLAAIVASMVLGMGGSLSEPAPNAELAFEYDSAASTVSVYHDGGATLEADNTKQIELTGADIDESLDLTNSSWNEAVFSGMSADGQTATISGDIDAETPIVEDASLGSGTQMQVVWHSPDGGNSQVIGTYEAP